MKQIEHFNTFLHDIVNLDQTRIGILESRVVTVQNFLANSGYEPLIRAYSKQGSWAHKTIIRPRNGKEFDADLVVYLDPAEGWSPRDYILELRRVFWASNRYREMTSMKTRCVTLNYAGDFHLDVIPIVVKRDARTNGVTFWVCNRAKVVFEETDGNGYTEWWRGQDALTVGHLKRVTRLVKYLRDIKGTFSIKSVLLTTLLGERISLIDELVHDKFADIPTALKTIIGRLDDYLQENEKMPEVDNPALPGESFTRKWNQEQYDTFREKMQDYRVWIDDAYGEKNRDESICKWRRVFGDGFAKSETADRATTAVARLAESFEPGQDLVAVVLTYGGGVLARMPRIFLHVEPPPQMSNNRIPVRVIAHEKGTEDGPVVRALQSGEPIGPQSGIMFQAVSNAGLPFPRDYQVCWQVVNTDRAAAEDGGLRGEFYRSDTHGGRYEPTKYRGVHWVQAFLINKRTKLCDGMSDRFFVVIR